MAWIALNCPQCSAPLPRLAIWRSVKCASCGSLITKKESVVYRDSFRQAWIRATALSHSAGFTAVQCGGARYQLLQTLGAGEISQVWLAQRIGAVPLLAALKLSPHSAAAGRYAREAEVLRELRALDGDSAGGYFSRLLPEVMSHGAALKIGEANASQHCLVLRYPSGFWGSLAGLHERFPSGIDPRHAVWIWRRILEMLGFIHGHGWSHGDIRPEHALVHPQNHAVQIISWSSAIKAASAEDKAADLMRSARVLQVLLSGSAPSDALPGSVPPGLARLVIQTAQDLGFCRTRAASDLDASLRAEANAAFGPPRFLPLEIQP